MELMLIVWLVSILSSVKAFVSSYITVIVIVALAIYLGTKVNHRYLRRKFVGSYRDGTQLIYKNLQVGSVLIPKDSFVNLDVYDSYCFVSCSPLGVSRARVDRGAMEHALQPELATEKETELVMPLLTGAIPKRLAYVCYTLIGLQVLLPSDNTIKYMAGAYLIQSTYDSEFVQTALPLGQKAVINQLERWSKDSEELKDLLLEGANK